MSEKEAQKEAKKKLRREAKLKAIERRQDRLAKRPPPNTFIGKHKWLGGAVDPKTGYIYGVPSHAIEIIEIRPPTEIGEKAKINTIPLPNQYKEGKFKWLRGVIFDGHLYAIPSWSTHGVLKVRLTEESRFTKGPRVKVLPLPNPPEYYETIVETNEKIVRGQFEYTSVDRGRWMWHGGQIAIDQNGDPALYCVPSNAVHVLKVNLATEAVEEIGPPLPEGQNKWYGGILGNDGCIYGMCYTATGVLRIDPKYDSVEIIGEFPEGNYKWHGGLLCHKTGIIYAFPAHENVVLCVDTKLKDDCFGTDQSWRVSTIPIQRHQGDKDSPDLQFKWLGGSYGADGNIYGMPSDATSILKIDTEKHQAFTFGEVSPDKNKFQGGVLGNDKCIYALCADYNSILRIDTNPDTPLTISFVGAGFQNCDDKWQGGFIGKDSRIYAIPECCDNVVVITPGDNPTVEMI
jgi:hypothetical protein